MRRLVLALLALGAAWSGAARAQPVPDPVGIALEGYPYPHPVAFMPATMSGEAVRMAYMDVAPNGAPNGRAVVLLHGRNFPASYWEPVIRALSGAGYRVVVPDQVGFGKSSKPAGYVSFDDMARLTAALLDTLSIPRADIVAHSMGGMLGVRFTRTYPARVGKLVLQAPLGLEDYRVNVPPVETERLVAQERALTADGYRRQLLANYQPTRPAIVDPYVALRERIRGSGEYERWLRSFAGSYQTIYREPVAHEIALIDKPVLFLMGARDFNAPGKPLAPEAARAGMGQNAKLAQGYAVAMKNARAIVFEDAGHMVHLDQEERFNTELLRFLGEP